MVELYDAKEVADYLIDFSNEKGINKYSQISGRKFADEFWFYKDKSKIILIKNNESKEFKISNFNIGRLYEFIDDNKTYSINLNNKFPKEILMTIDNGEDSDSFVLELEKLQSSEK